MNYVLKLVNFASHIIAFHDNATSELHRSRMASGHPTKISLWRSTCENHDFCSENDDLFLLKTMKFAFKNEQHQNAPTE